MKHGDQTLSRWLLVGIIGGVVSGLVLPFLPEAGVFGVAVSAIFLSAAVFGYAVKHGIIAAKQAAIDEAPPPEGDGASGG